jgi:hypothetical protein
MTHDVSRQIDSALHRAGAPAEQPAEKSVGISVGGVLDMLTDGADVEDVLRAFPDLTRDELRAMLADVPMREETLVSDGSKTFISPQAFYRDAVQREDIRRILAALAK